MGGCGSPKPKAVVATSTDPAPTLNPLTGMGTAPIGPVIAVKVDDTQAGRPSLGLEKADVIYIEEAEGGLSRMVAVYASARPKVRAVRSVRTSDPELLGAYGKIILVASGGGAPLCQRWTAQVCTARSTTAGRSASPVTSPGRRHTTSCTTLRRSVRPSKGPECEAWDSSGRFTIRALPQPRPRRP